MATTTTHSFSNPIREKVSEARVAAAAAGAVVAALGTKANTWKDGTVHERFVDSASFPHSSGVDMHPISRRG